MDTLPGAARALARFGLCACLLGATASLLAQVPEASAGDFLFQMPPGWNRVERGASVLLVPPAVPQGSIAYLALLPPQEWPGDPRSLSDAIWMGLRASYRQLSGSPVQVQRTHHGFDLASSSGMLVDPQGTTWLMVVFAAQNAGRGESAVYMSSAPQLFQLHLPGIETLVASLHFIPPPAPALGAAAGAPAANTTHEPAASATAAAEAGRPLAASGPVLKPGVYEVSEFNPEAQNQWWVALLPDGAFYEGLPALGLDGLNASAEMKKRDSLWGQYRPDANGGAVVFPGSGPGDTPIVWQVRPGLQGSTINGAHYKLLDPGDGARLDGMFRRGDEDVFPAHAHQGIRLTREGRFIDEGVLKAANFSLGAGNQEVRDDGVPGSGTYRVMNYTIELRYDDGRVKRCSFYLDPQASRTEARQFYLNIYRFVRQP
jgi:hypothetical protein